MAAVEEAKPLWQPYYISPRAAGQQILLDGTWELSFRGTPIQSLQELESQSKWIHAQVPSSVQWALYESGELPSPYQRLNSRKYAWVPDKVWYYRRRFDVPASAEHEYVFLCFDAAGYFLRVWINGVLVGRNEGMFGGPEVEVSKYLRFGQSNDLLVEAEAGSYGVEKWNPESTGKVILPWGVAGGNQYVTYASGIGPKELEPFGIWRSVRLEVVPRIHLERPFLVTQIASSQEAHLKLKAEVFVNAQSLEFQLHSWKPEMGSGFRDAWASKRVEKPSVLKVAIFEKESARPVLSRTFPLQLYEGRNFVEEDLSIPSPKLWWLNGLGRANLYRVKLALAGEGVKPDRMEFDYGIRTIRQEPSAGPRTQDRWANWQFVVNGRRFFVKGINWAWPLDVLYHLPHERYRWMLEAARNAGVQMIRVWGGGNPETEDFFALCDELGIMVWEDFPIGNQETPLYPQDVWEAQVLHIIFGLRNHASLAVWCGGNEFNPYSAGTAAVTGITERSVNDFDGTRLFIRTTPDPGDYHAYVDLDPTWYGELYRLVPFVSETGIFNMPEPQSLLEVIDAREFETPLRDIFSKEFAASHPEFIHHFLEYQGGEPRTLWSRATQMDDLSAPNLDTFCEASQVAAGEYTQILSDQVQANYPVTTGLMPWSFTVPWPIEFFTFVDGLDQATASYYFLKRTYEPVHVTLRLPQLIWAKGEKLPVNAAVLNAPDKAISGLVLSTTVLDTDFHSLWSQERTVALKPGPSVTDLNLGYFSIPDALEDKFFILVAELKRRSGELISRSVYWPRCLKQMSDPEFRRKYRSAPQPSLVFENGPWLKQEVAQSPARTTLKLQVVAIRDEGEYRSQIRLRVRNTGAYPAFLTKIDVLGTKRALFGTDNWFWLPAGEERSLDLEILWRDLATRQAALLTVGAWNAERVKQALVASAAARPK